jgi:hypothetical protein
MEATSYGHPRRRSLLPWLLAGAANFLAGALAGYVVRGATRGALEDAREVRRDAAHRAPAVPSSAPCDAMSFVKGSRTPPC